MDLTLRSTMKLSSGHEIPYIGLGVWESGPSVCAEACLAAFEVGYTHIDTAACYFNEKEVGEAVAKTNLAREKLFITTKVWDDAAGYDATLKAVRASLNKAKLEYFDLILLHSALPGPEKRHGSWKALEECVEKGLVRSIGVSNWSVKHLELLQSTNPKITPCVNQLELHPFLQQKPTVEYCQKHNIAIEAYSPLTRGIYFSDSTVKSIAEAHGVSPAQVLIRWSLQKGYIPLPKSVKKERIASNADVYGFQLSKEEMSRLDSLDKGQAGLTGSWLHDDNDPTSIFDPLDCE